MNEIIITSDKFVPIDMAMNQLEEKIQEAIYRLDENSYKKDHIRIYMCPLIVKQFLKVTFQGQHLESIDRYKGYQVFPGYELNTVIVAHKDGHKFDIPHTKIKLTVV